MKILIDNGHGSNTPGKCSPDKSLREFAYAREIAGMVVDDLKSKGYDAERLVPETTDIPLAERARRVNEWCGKLGTQNVILVSIHCNAAGNGSWMSAGGWCAYTSPGVGYPFHMQAITNSKECPRLSDCVGYPFHMQAITNCHVKKD